MGLFDSNGDEDAFLTDVEPKIPFALHQIYERPGDTKQVVCAECGADRLEVGYGSFFTVVRCPTCRHEWCIHEG